MKKSRFTEEQVIGFFMQAEAHLDMHARKSVLGGKAPAPRRRMNQNGSASRHKMKAAVLPRRFCTAAAAWDPAAPMLAAPV